MITVGSEPHGPVVVIEMLPRKRARTVGENGVVFCEAFFHSGWSGDHNHPERAEAEEHDGTVVLTEFLEGPVNGWLHEMKMAYDRQARGARWHALAFPISSRYYEQRG